VRGFEKQEEHSATEIANIDYMYQTPLTTRR